jgi:hypothetical protein
VSGTHQVKEGLHWTRNVPKSTNGRTFSFLIPVFALCSGFLLWRVILTKKRRYPAIDPPWRLALEDMGDVGGHSDFGCLDGLDR